MTRHKLLETKPIRFVCGVCFEEKYISLEVYLHKSQGSGQVSTRTSVLWPHCCNQDLLIAGEPKIDVHGLRQKGAVIDPVDNIRPLPRSLTAAEELDPLNMDKPRWGKMEELG